VIQPGDIIEDMAEHGASCKSGSGGKDTVDAMAFPATGPQNRTDAIRLARVRKEAQKILARFLEIGAVHVETAILQPAELLLDLYGENIRSRAFVTRDPLRGEFMLRPDYTVPVAKMHMDEGGSPAHCAYLGPVWRMQPASSDQPAESLQVGYEAFGVHDRARSDAEVFGLFADLLAPDPVTVTIGDLGILLAAIDGMSTSKRRKAALRRHLW